MDEKLHILFLTHWFPSRKSPKNGNFILRHAQAVATLHTVTVVFAERDKTLSSDFEIVERNEKGVRIIYVYFRGSNFTIRNYWHKYQAYKRGIKLVEKFDLIHLNVLHYYAFIAVYYKLFRKVRFVITEHWSLWKNHPSRIFTFCMRYITRNSSFLLPVSSDLELNMKKKGIKGRFCVIPNVVDTEAFGKKTDSVNKRYTFLHISNMAEVKNIPGIVNSVHKLAKEGYDFQLCIGGDGDTSFIQEFIRQKGLENHISVFGELTEKEVSEKMRYADCFVMFSTTENQPCVINESFSSGLPVIATRVGGIAEFFPDDFGVLIESGNENELYKAMKNCLEGTFHFADAATMHQYAVNQFGIHSIAKEIDSIYQQVIKE